jgi:hypothetical protein
MKNSRRRGLFLDGEEGRRTDLEFVTMHLNVGFIQAVDDLLENSSRMGDVVRLGNAMQED